MTDDAELAAACLQHMRAMGACGTREDAVKWMAAAYNLLDATAKRLEAPRIYVIPGTYGERTYVATAPTAEVAVLPAPGFKPEPAVWFRGHTTPYGDRYANTKAWTGRDTRALERAQARIAARESLQAANTKRKAK